MIYENIEALIGKTPLLHLAATAREEGISARLLAKLESFNPGGSAKDRIARAMLDAAEKSGALKPGGTVIEPTSGNTGVGLAMLAATRGYAAVIVMPDNMSRERILLMRAFGATVVLTPAKEGMRGAIARAETLAKETPGAFIPAQFDNPANAEAHYETTGPEIWTDTDGAVDILVAGVGTGGTLTGTARYLKEKNPALVVIAVEPKTSAVLSGGEVGAHGISGIGAGFVPTVLDPALIDEVIPVSEAEASAAARALARREGVLAGISSGAALAAAIAVAKREENREKTLAVILPDTGERYLSTPLFAEK